MVGEVKVEEDSVDALHQTHHQCRQVRQQEHERHHKQHGCRLHVRSAHALCAVSSSFLCVIICLVISLTRRRVVFIVR